jgi:hypothetical protein
MLSIKQLGVACLVIAFAPISWSAGAADLGGAPKRSKPPPVAVSASMPSCQPGVRRYDSPPIWSGAYVGLSAGYRWGRSEQQYDRAGNHGLASTSPNGPLAALTPSWMSTKCRSAIRGAGRLTIATHGYSANRESYYFDNGVDLVRTGLTYKV